MGIYLELELQGHMVTLGLTFWALVIMFSKVAAAFHILTSSVWEFQTLHVLTNTFFTWLFDYNHPC